MIVSVCSYKGGVAKTTTAIHLARYFADRGSTVLVDSDPNRNALAWAQRGDFPFRAIPETQILCGNAGRFAHAVIDTRGRPDLDMMREIATSCEMLILPTNAQPLALQALYLMVQHLRQIKDAAPWRALLTMVPPPPSPRGAHAREAITREGILLFASEVRHTVAFQDAVIAGFTVDQTGSPLSLLAWQDYERVGQEIEEAVFHETTAA